LKTASGARSWFLHLARLLLQLPGAVYQRGLNISDQDALGVSAGFCISRGFFSSSWMPFISAA
jgi:hypothetical protein